MSLRIAATLITVGSVVVCSAASSTARSSQRSAASGALTIVVVAGEDAVNIVQQKTAVAPIVEVRDRNDQPVAGAVVNFAIRGGRASFGGARTLAVTTDAAGRAAATGLTPTASGALQINATAAFQGQTATITITQTNVLTVAQAAAVSSGVAASGGSAGAGGGGAAAGGAGAGTGGGAGLSATTIGIIGGAAAGGAVLAREVATGDASGEQSYSGAFAFDWVVGCLVERMTGTLTIEFVATSETPDTVPTNGRLDLDDTTSAVVSRPANCGVLSNGNWGMPGAPVTGTLGALQALGQDTVQGQIAGTTFQRSYEFRGALTNGVVSGTFSMTWRSNLPPPFDQHGGISSVTLNRVP